MKASVMAYFSVQFAVIAGVLWGMVLDPELHDVIEYQVPVGAALLPAAAWTYTVWALSVPYAWVKAVNP